MVARLDPGGEQPVPQSTRPLVQGLERQPAPAAHHGRTLGDGGGDRLLETREIERRHARNLEFVSLADKGGPTQ
ncbi:hypothetical protein GCM10009550_12010 [Actinocorallia libanotica]|uniref:Uncharacterized protein n=1 Tax=Actinocorallia libanotica TaxID=46162 RepID=A0ABN1QFI8_9ACTN